MKILHGVNASVPEAVSRGTVVALGNFDGVHLGHRAILSKAVAQAAHLGVMPAVFTFWPHPQLVLRPAEPNQAPAKELLCMREERADLIAGLGVELLVEQPFDASFASMEPARFFRDILVRGLGARAIVVGFDFAFGRGRSGNTELLGDLCREAGVQLTVVQALAAEGGPISSSRIRGLLSAGDVETAAKLLGSRFFYRGTIVHGDGRGDRIGIPTANLLMPAKIRLPNGVYATLSYLGDSRKAIPSVTNVGVRPTFHVDPTNPVIETHFLRSSGNVYDERLTVEFVTRIREERRFSGVDELKIRIAQDIAEARKVLPN